MPDCLAAFRTFGVWYLLTHVQNDLIYVSLMMVELMQPKQYYFIKIFSFKRFAIYILSAK